MGHAVLFGGLVLYSLSKFKHFVCAVFKQGLEDYIKMYSDTVHFQASQYYHIYQ